MHFPAWSFAGNYTVGDYGAGKLVPVKPLPRVDQPITALKQRSCYSLSVAAEGPAVLGAASNGHASTTGTKR